MSRSTFCNYCNRRSLAQWQRPNIALHSLLIVATCGAWLPVWLLVMFCGGRWVCSNCGTKQ